MIFLGFPLFFTGLASQGLIFEKQIYFYFWLLLGWWLGRPGRDDRRDEYRRTPLDWPILGFWLACLAATIFPSIVGTVSGALSPILPRGPYEHYGYHHCLLFDFQPFHGASAQNDDHGYHHFRNYHFGLDTSCHLISNFCLTVWLNMRRSVFPVLCSEFPS